MIQKTLAADTTRPGFVEIGLWEAVSLCPSSSPSTIYMPLAFDFDESSVPFQPLSPWSPEPQLFRQLSGFPESVIRTMRQSSYKAIMASPPDTSFHASCKDSIGTRQSLLYPSSFERVSHLDTPKSADTFILTDVHIIVYEVDLNRGATWNVDLAELEDSHWFIALCVCGSSIQRGCEDIQRRVIYWVGFKGDFKGNFSLVGNLRIEQDSRKFSTRPIHWSSLLSTLIASRYASTPILKIPIIVMDLDFNFGAIFRWNHLDFLPYSLPTKSVFSFLRYYGPKRLRGARRVVLDKDGFQITHIGQGAFAVISRVWHRPSGEIRVMKRITFDKSGLAEYLVRNEIETLEAMKGNVWFPPLLNHFKEGGEFVVTMVSPPLL